MSFFSKEKRILLLFLELFQFSAILFFFLIFVLRKKIYDFIY